MQETPEAEQTAVKTGDYTPQNRLVSDNLSRGPLQVTTTYMEKMHIATLWFNWMQGRQLSVSPHHT